MLNPSLKVALIQFAAQGDPQANDSYFAKEIEKAAQQGAKLIVLPELHRSHYFPQTEDPNNFDLAETIPGPATRFFGELAKKHQVVLVISLFEKRAAGLYHNTAVVIEKDGHIVGKYRKMHIPDDPGFSEKFYFTPGDLGFEPIQTSVGKLGVLVCWDQWFPEAARLMALAGADCLIYPTAIAWCQDEDQAEQQRQHDAWVTIQRGHAIANGLPTLVCNRVGTENNLTFWGNSFIAGPQGEMLAKASTDQAEILVTTLDHTRSETVRRMWPFLRDRRIDAYRPLEERLRDKS